MGKCECGRLKGNPCGPLRPNTINVTMPTSLAYLRGLILATFLLGLIGSGTELILLGHSEDFWQYIPIVLMGLSLICLAGTAVRPSRMMIRFFQCMMVLFLASGVAGLWLHYRANIEFELEVYPSLAGWELFWKAIQGKSPPSLAPGMMFVLGLLGWVYAAFRHPSQQSKPSD